MAADTKAVPLRDVAVAVGPDALPPSSAVVAVDRVAVHAVRHLALLRHTDSVVAAVLGAQRELDRAVGAVEPVGPVPAGRIG